MSQFYEAATRPQIARIEFEMVTANDDSPDLSYLETTPDHYIGHATTTESIVYAAQDAERLRGYRDGDWTMIGVRARAHVTLPVGQGSFVAMELESPGCWGVESDSDAQHIAGIFSDECESLRSMLRTLADATYADAAIRELSR